MKPKKQDDSLIRLNKVIADSGLCSRRNADMLIEQGQVKVNGKIVTEMGFKINPEQAKVLVNNEPLPFKKNVDIIFYKPKGVITTKQDDRGRKTIYDLLPEDLQKINPAGRLDRDTSGILILSSDGEFIQQITKNKTL